MVFYSAPPFLSLLPIERFNRVLKQTVQVAILQHQPWKSAVTDFLLVYRATPHAATGTLPFRLLYGRQMSPKLSVLPSAPVPPPTDITVRHRVTRLQHKMKTYTDAKQSACTPCFQAGTETLACT